MSVEVEEKGGLAGGFVDVRVCCRSGRYSEVFVIVFIISAIDAPRHDLIVCRVVEAASRSTVLVSMTALQQQQATVVLPLTLPLSDPPLCVEITHSSVNANLLAHSVDVAGSEGLWEGDLQCEQTDEVGAPAALHRAPCAIQFFNYRTRPCRRIPRIRALRRGSPECVAGYRAWKGSMYHCCIRRRSLILSGHFFKALDKNQPCHYISLATPPCCSTGPTPSQPSSAASHSLLLESVWKKKRWCSV